MRLDMNSKVIKGMSNQLVPRSWLKRSRLPEKRLFLCCDLWCAHIAERSLQILADAHRAMDDLIH